MKFLSSAFQFVISPNRALIVHLINVLFVSEISISENLAVSEDWASSCLNTEFLQSSIVIGPFSILSEHHTTNKLNKNNKYTNFFL